MLDVLLELFGFVMDFQMIWQLLILLIREIVVLVVLDQFSCVGEEDFLEEGCVFPHEPDLVVLVNSLVSCLLFTCRHCD